MILNRFIAVVLLYSLLAGGIAVAQNRRRERRANRPVPTQSNVGSDSRIGEPLEADLTGTYKGTVNFPLAKMAGEATLIITGTRFQLTSGNTELTGLIAVSRRVVAMSFENLTHSDNPDSEASPLVISLRMHRLGCRLSLNQVSNETEFSFIPLRASAPTSSDTREASGKWLVILGSYSEAEIHGANERLALVCSRGYDARIVNSDNYPNLKGGLWIVVMGPYTKNNAESLKNKMRSIVSDAYIKSGW